MSDYFGNGVQNVLGGLQFVQQGIADGTERKKQAGLASLAGEFYGQQSPLLGQVAQIDPRAASQMASQQQEFDAEKHKRGARLASMLVAAPNDQMRAQMWPQIAQQFNAMGLEVPEQYSPDLLPVAQQYAQAFGGMEGPQPESFSNAGNGIMLGNRGTTREIPGYADAAGRLAEATAGAKAQFRPEPAPKASPRNTMAERMQTLQNEIFPGLQQELGERFTPAMRQQVAAQYMGTGQFRIADPAGSPGGAQNRKQSQAERVKVAQLDTIQQQIDRLQSASDALNSNAVFDGGPLDQYAVKWTKQGQELDQAGAAILPVLTALTRVPGIGAQSDLESRLQKLQIPDASMHPEVRKAAIAALRAYMADLAKAYQGQQAEAPAAAPANSGWSIKAIP